VSAGFTGAEPFEVEVAGDGVKRFSSPTFAEDGDSVKCDPLEATGSLDRFGREGLGSEKRFS
jgi:hypothetical protein